MKDLPKIIFPILVLLMAFWFVHDMAFAQQSDLELRLNLPEPPKLFNMELSVPAPIIRFFNVIKEIFVPPICPVDPDVCGLNLRDVGDPSNNFTLGWRCRGKEAPCSLYAEPYPPPAGGVSANQIVANLTGEGAIGLNLDQLGKTAITYELRDRYDQFCERQIAHAFSTGVSPAPRRTLSQVVYRFFNNADSVTPGSPLAAQNSVPSIAKNSTFRLRLLVQVQGLALSQSGFSGKLQWATKSGTCATSSYGNVASASGAIRYNDNATPIDGDALGVTVNDPTNEADTVINQTYEELNDFSNSIGAVAIGQDGHWDFSLTHFFSGTGFSTTNYCFRVVASDGTLLDSYGVYPEISVF